MASAKQAAANKQNALKSTGPKNTQTVRFNALRHGLRAKILILPDENPAEFRSLLQDLETEWQPQTPSEFIQVERMAVNYWKLARADRREAFYRLNDMPDRFVDQSFKFQQGFERSFDRAQQALERLQKNHCAAAADSSASLVTQSAPEPVAMEPIEVQCVEPSPEPPVQPPVPTPTPSAPTHQVSAVARRYSRRQSAEIEKRERALMKEGFLRPVDYMDYPKNAVKPQITELPPPAFDIIHSTNDLQE